jgi:cell division inhibitor SepF
VPGLVTQLKEFIGDLFPEENDIDLLDETENEAETEDIIAPASKKAPLSAVRPINTHGYEVVVIEPTSFNDSLEIAKNLSERKTVVLNLEMLENESSQRIVDFLSGATFALDGHQQKIGEGVFIFTPKNVNISSEQEKSKPITTEGFWNVPQ